MLHHKECTDQRCQDLESHFGSGFLDFGFWTLHLCLQQPTKLQSLSVKRQQLFFLVVLPVIFIAHSKELLSLTSINCKTSLVLLCRLAGLPPKDITWLLHEPKRRVGDRQRKNNSEVYLWFPCRWKCNLLSNLWLLEWLNIFPSGGMVFPHKHVRKYKHKNPGHAKWRFCFLNVSWMYVDFVRSEWRPVVYGLCRPRSPWRAVFLGTASGTAAMTGTVFVRAIGWRWNWNPNSSEQFHWMFAYLVGVTWFGQWWISVRAEWMHWILIQRVRAWKWMSSELEVDV